MAPSGHQSQASVSEAATAGQADTPHGAGQGDAVTGHLGGHYGCGQDKLAQDICGSAAGFARLGIACCGTTNALCCFVSVHQYSGNPVLVIFLLS